MIDLMDSRPIFQFFILSAFVWMTLMSYEIFKQIRGMQVRYVYLHHFILCHFLNKFNREYSRKKFLYYSQVIKMAQESDILRKKVPIG